MLQVEVHGLDQLLAKFDGLSAQISEAEREMPQQLLEWQREDMHRKYPNMLTGQGAGNETVALTSIWPRARFTDPSMRKRVRSRAGPRVHSPRPVVHSTRPVLRPQLYEKLVQRMTVLIVKAMKWP